MAEVSILPLVPAGHYMNMLTTFQPGHESILVSRSNSGLDGVPALFDAAYFNELTGGLHGEGGSKQMIRTHRKRVLHLDCDAIEEDLDTPDDYHRLHGIYLDTFYRRD